jgi:hypothetical protein
VLFGLGSYRMMKAWQAWREAAKLFWQRPVLSLPVLTAAISPFVIDAVNHWFMRWLLPPPIEAYGVRSPLSQTLLQPVKAYWPLLLGGFFVYVVFCVVALFVTAGGVRRLKSEEPTALLRYGVVFARSRWRAVMWMSLVGLVLFAIYEAARFIVFYFSLTDLMDRMLSHDSVWRVEVSALYALISCIGAWILTAMAMRHIGAVQARTITSHEVRRGRWLAVATVLVSIALGLAMTHVKQMVIPEGGLDGTVAEWELKALHSLITAFPYVLLFIALTRIVDQDSNTVT